jgi:hypothetical protein
MSVETDCRLAVLKAITEWCVALGWDEDTAESIAREFVRKIQESVK